MSFSRLVPLHFIAIASVAAACNPPTPPSPPSAPVASVTIYPDGLTLAVGGQGNLSADVRAADNSVLPSTGVRWSSLNGTIASVSGSGLVTANAVGTARVIAAAGEKADSVNVLVVSAAGLTLSLDPTSANIPVGGSAQFTVIAKNAAGQIVTVGPAVWASGNPGVGIVVAGLAAGLTVGTTPITARVGSVTSPMALLTVRAAGLECDGVEMTSSWQVSLTYSYSTALTNGEAEQVSVIHGGTFTATLTPLGGQLPAISWEGSLAGNVTLNDRIIHPGTPSVVETLFGSGAPVTGQGRSVFRLSVDLDACSYSFSLNPFAHATHAPPVEVGDIAIGVLQSTDPLGSWRALGLASLGANFEAHFIIAANRTGKDTYYPFGVGQLLWSNNGSVDAPQGAAGVSFTIIAH